MKLLFLPLITLCLISGCSLAPQKLNRDNYLAISGDYEKPNSDYLTQVMGLPLNPYDSICRQNVVRGNWWGLRKRYSISSSAYLDGGILITAAHNFAESFFRFSYADDFYLECQTGYAEAGEELQSYEGAHFSTDKTEYIHTGYSLIFDDFGIDAALVKLCPQASELDSSFRLATSAEIAEFKESIEQPDRNSSFEFIVAGYAAADALQNEPAAVEGDFNGSRLMHIKSTARSMTGNVFYYNVNKTYGGMSGGPVWIEIENDGTTEFVIIGIHVTNEGAFLLNEKIINQYEKMRAMTCP